MLKLRHSIAMSVLATVLSGPVHAAGVEGAQLQPVPVPVDSSCNRIFFRSSQHFNHTVFVVPHAVPGTMGDSDVRSFTFAPIPGANMQDATGRKWFLYLKLRFPSDGEVSLGRGASSQTIDEHMCDFDTVKVQINRADPSLKIFTIAPIPLTSIQVNIPGIQDVGSIGLTAEDHSRIATKDDTASRNEPDIIQSNGETLTAIFKVTDAEKEFFQNAMSNGVTVTVRYQFQASQRLGSITATVDLNSLASNFKAAVKGQVSIVKGQIGATLKNAVDNRSVTITSEGGSGDAFNKIQSQIVDKIMQEVSMGAQAAAPADAKAGDDAVPVSAVLDIIKSRIGSNFSFNQMSLPERATAQQEVQFRATTVYDSNIKHISLQSGYTDPSSGFTLNAGQQFTISPAYWYIDNIDYSQVQLVDYISVSKMNELRLASLSGFPDLRDPRMKIKNNITDKDIEKMADQPESSLGKAYQALTSKDDEQNVHAIGTYWWFSPLIKAPGQYFWLRTKSYPNRNRDGYEKHVAAATVEEFKQIPVGLTFSALGDRAIIPFANLLTPNDFWSAKFDPTTRRLILSAKVNLGTIQFRPLAKFDAMNDKGIPDFKEAAVNLETVQEVLQAGMVGARKIGDPVVVARDARAIVRQKTMVFYLTQPEKTPDTPEAARAPSPSADLSILAVPVPTQ
jgi:hypothetical protein